MFFSFENPESRSFETGFPPWYDPESPVVFQEEKSEVSNAWPSHEPVRSNSGSYVTNNISSGSVANERKRRRMISNRESARRSRMRKQNHMEDLKKQQTRLRMVNRESLNRLMLTVHQNRLIRSENERLQSEAAILRRRLWDLRQVLVVRQHSNPPSAWPCNDVTTINGQSPHYSLIT